MRVEAVQKEQNIAVFTSRPRRHQFHHVHQDDDYYELPNLNSGYVKPSKRLDMEKIYAIEPQTQTEEKPLSFNDSHAKFTLDKYQKEASDAFIKGNTTIVTAPTGIGKTLIAEHGINDALKKGERIIYLSPLKALSNEKFVQFSKLFGNYDDEGNLIDTSNVGIITGDISINPDAPLVVMTTEIYRNMLNASDEQTTADDLKDFTGVIYDEFHYLKDPSRGTVWEEAVMSTPKHMRQMMLSATASNASDIASWMQELNPDREVTLVNVPEDERYVPIKEYVYAINSKGEHRIEEIFEPQINIKKLSQNLSDRQKEAAQELEKLYNGANFIDIINRFQKSSDGIVNAKMFAQKLKTEKGLAMDKAEQIAYVLSDPKHKRERYLYLEFDNSKNTSPLVRKLTNLKMTPALFFVFSKKGCKTHMDEAMLKAGPLLTPKESRKVLDIVNKAKDEGIYLGEDFDEEYLPALLMGFSVTCFVLNRNTA